MDSKKPEGPNLGDLLEELCAAGGHCLLMTDMGPQHSTRRKDRLLIPILQETLKAQEADS